MTPPPSEATLLSGSPEKAMATMLGIMLGLKELYMKETDAMKKHDVNRFLSLQPAKEAYTRDYEILVREIQARSLSIKSMETPLRDRLIAEQKELTVLAEESMGWSLRMAESLRRVQERLVIAAREALKKDKTSYSASGHIGDTGRPAATAFNQAC